MKRELEEMIEKLDELSDAIWLLSRKPVEVIEHRYHEQICLPMLELMARVKNLEAKIPRVTIPQDCGRKS